MISSNKLSVLYISPSKPSATRKHSSNINNQKSPFLLLVILTSLLLMVGLFLSRPILLHAQVADPSPANDITKYVVAKLALQRLFQGQLDNRYP